MSALCGDARRDCSVGEDGLRGAKRLRHAELGMASPARRAQKNVEYAVRGCAQGLRREARTACAGAKRLCHAELGMARPARRVKRER